MSPNNSQRLIHSLTNKFLFQELKSSSDLILKRQSSRNRKLPESLIPQEFLPRLTLRKGTIHRQRRYPMCFLHACSVFLTIAK